MQTSSGVRSTDGRDIAVRTFLIADIRGYSTFTRERGHAEAATLAARFMELAGDAIEASSGTIVETRGDQVLATFPAPPLGVRAGVELQLACTEEAERDASLRIPAGVGIDVGESTRAGDQYHGEAVNLAARLCAQAAAGEVLISRAVEDELRDTTGLVLQERGSVEFKGFDAPVEVLSVTALPATRYEAVLDLVSLPPELDPLVPMVGRRAELRWLRGTWRRARRGRGAVVFVSGPPQMGKTRLAAELAGEVSSMGGRVRFAGPGGTATAGALAAIREAAVATAPEMVVLDAFDAHSPEEVQDRREDDLQHPVRHGSEWYTAPIPPS